MPVLMSVGAKVNDGRHARKGRRPPLLPLLLAAAVAGGAHVDFFVVDVDQQAFAHHLLKVHVLFVIHVQHLAELLQTSVAVPRFGVQRDLKAEKISLL